jgi:hypothetical protein
MIWYLVPVPSYSRRTFPAARSFQPVRHIMKLPSIRQSIQEARATFRRFSIVICVAFLATCAALILVDYEGPAGPTVLFQILLAGILGIPLLTALVLIAERMKLRTPSALALQTAGVLLLAAYAVTVPADLTRAPSAALIQFFILAVAFHLFVAAAPFAVKGESNGFWHYNKALFLRVLTALLYSGVLYAGLSVALAALDNLFGIHVPGKRYFELWIFINGLFTTWFFLAGVPDDLPRLDTVTDYPRGLKVFAQYILFPIVLVYLVILYAYLGKILVAWDWPQGWVSKLILGFSGVGMFSLLLLHPVTGRADNGWIARVARWFYVILIPLVVMLFLAVWRRVSEYGITEGRYVALAMVVWLACLVVYFTLGKSRSIKFIPASLCILALIASFGPWGALSVSRQSQIARLGQIAARSGVLAGGKVLAVHAAVTFQDAKQISALLSYLHEVHGFDGIQSWFDVSLKEDSISSGVAYKSPSAVATLMGLEYVERWRESPGGAVTLEAENAFDLMGYDHVMQLPWFQQGDERTELPGEGITCHVTEGMNRITFNAVGTGAELLGVDFRGHAERLLTEYGASATRRIPSEKMAATAAGNGLKVKVCPWEFQVRQSNGETKLLWARAVVLYTVEKKP